MFAAPTTRYDRILAHLVIGFRQFSATVYTYQYHLPNPPGTIVLMALCGFTAIIHKSTYIFTTISINFTIRAIHIPYYNVPIFHTYSSSLSISKYFFSIKLTTADLAVIPFASSILLTKSSSSDTDIIILFGISSSPFINVVNVSNVFIV